MENEYFDLFTRNNELLQCIAFKIHLRLIECSTLCECYIEGVETLFFDHASKRLSLLIMHLKKRLSQNHGWFF